MKYYSLHFCVDDMSFSSKEIMGEPPEIALGKIKTMAITRDYNSCFYVLLRETDDKALWKNKIIDVVIQRAMAAKLEHENKIDEICNIVAELKDKRERLINE